MTFLLSPAYLVAFDRPTDGQNESSVIPAVQKVPVSAVLVRWILGWPVRTRIGRLVDNAPGNLRVLSLFSLTRSGARVSKEPRVPLALSTSPCTERTEVLRAVPPVLVRSMVALPDPFVCTSECKARMARP